MMKPKKILCILSVLAISVLSAGCAGSQPVNDSRGAADSSASGSAVQTDALQFADDFLADLPECSTFETFTMTPKPDLSLDALYEVFDQAVEQYFPGTFTDAEKESLYEISGSDRNGEHIGGTYTALKDRYQKENLPMPWLWFTCDKAMMQMLPNGALQTETGNVAYVLEYGAPGNIGMYCAADENPVKERIHIPLDGTVPDRTIKLLDGEVPLKEACAYTIDFLKKDFDPKTGNPELEPDIADIWLVEMKNGVTGLYMELTMRYQGIRFDTSYKQDGQRSFYIYDKGEQLPYALQSAYVFMIEKEKFDSIMVFGTAHAQDLTDRQSCALKISYQDAQEQLRGEVSNLANMLFTRAELVYLPKLNLDNLENNSMQVRAYWKFRADNKTDQYSYVFYVDAETGEVDYYKY